MKITTVLADWLVEDTGDIVENNRRKIIANSYNKNTLDASKVGYCAHVEIEWTCPVCNGKWTDRLDRRTYYKHDCPYCKKTNTSVGEQVLYKILSRELPGKVELHKNINGYEFDICVKDLNLLIEYNGVYYHKSEKARKMDEYKRKLAADHGYSIVTILELTRPCDEDTSIYRDFCYIMDSERQACGAREFIRYRLNKLKRLGLIA